MQESIINPDRVISQESDTKPSIIVKIVAIYLLGLSAFLLYLLGSSILVFLVLSESMKVEYEYVIPYLYFDDYSELLIVPYVYFFLFVFLGSRALNLFTGSPKSWKRALLAVIVVPIIVFVVKNHVSSIFTSLTNQEYLNLTTDQIGSYLLDFFLTSIFYIIGIILLLFAKRKFRFHQKDTNTIMKYVFIAISVIAFVGIVFVTSRVYMSAHNPDYKYDEISQSVDFHVYQPDLSQIEQTQGTEFHMYEWDESYVNSVGMYEAVRSIYTEEHFYDVGQVPSLILIQTQPTADFKLTQFANDLMELSKVSVVEVSLSSDGKAYVVANDNPRGLKDMKVLTFVTDDNVLIYLISAKISQEELVQFANALY